MKETDLPVILKEEETNQEQEQGQRRETNDGDENEQKTVKLVRDDSGLSIQTKHINTDQKLEREETQQEALSDIVQKETKTGKHSEEEKPVTSKSDKTGFQVVNEGEKEKLPLISVKEEENNADKTEEKSETEDEIVTEPEPVKDIVSAAGKREMKETNLPEILKEEETNQEQEQGQRRETNDGDENEQKTVKLVRDDSGLSIETKHINTDQKLEREETQQEALSDIVQKETKTGKHSEEEKPVTSKSDKTGFQVVNEGEKEKLPLISVKEEENNADKTEEKSETEDEIVTEPEPVKDIVSAAGKREMKETDLPVILKEETNQEQEQGRWRRETNDGDENEQKTVKLVRDDSGLSIQTKHINTDQKMEREETQQEALRDEDEKETKTGKHSEEEKPVTSKSDKTGFQVVNEGEKEKLPLISVKEEENNADKTEEKSETEDEIVTEPEPVKDIVSAAGKREMKETDLPVILKEETNQEQEQGQRRETNDGDENEQKTVKLVRDDSGLSIQIKHINTDQKMEREETQQEAVRDEDEKETKTGKHSEEEKPVTSKSDKTGFQVVNEGEKEKLPLISVKEEENNADKTEEKSEAEDEIVTEPEPVKDIVSAAGKLEMKETDLPVILKEEETNQEQEQGQRRETNDGDESKEETVKPVRDDSGLSIQIKHNNTDQKLEREETQQEALSDIVQKETKTGKHSEEEKPVTSKSDKTGFQVVNEGEKEKLPLISVKEEENNADKTEEKSETEDEIVTEPEPVKDIVSAAGKREMKETDLPVILKEETNQEQEQGQRRETNDGDENEQKTVKLVRDDSGLSIQTKYINTDQKMEREETQQEAVRDEDEKETKTGKHSEEEKPVTSKSDKIGFQVVNEGEKEKLPLISVKEEENNADKTGEKSETEDEIVTEPEPVKDIVSAAGERQTKETDLPVIQKEEETNQEQEQGQRRETNDGDESKEETVKPVRDDSGLSIQIKHINTDQKMEREETQKAAVSEEDEKETKTEKEIPKTEDNRGTRCQLM
nr:DNA ligase 1-like [Labrus bergylta]